jgi:TPP-dependent pyruvate/acetoin dehydrogenase alpha subunit
LLFCKGKHLFDLNSQPCLQRLDILERKMIEEGIMIADEIKSLKARLRVKVEEVFAFAEKQPLPDEAETLDLHQVYATVPGGVNL